MQKEIDEPCGRGCHEFYGLILISFCVYFCVNVRKRSGNF